MDLSWIWQPMIIILVGTLLLRISGRKTIAQMTISESVLMIAIGTLLIQPVSGKNLWITFGTGAVLVLSLLLLKYAQLKSDRLETLISGQSKVLIDNGILNEENMTKLKMTVDQLEMKLRQQNVTKISDVEWATLEPNGQIGLALKPEAQPIKQKDLQQLQQSIQNLTNQTQFQPIYQPENNQQNDLFKEIEDKEHTHSPPNHLQ